MSLLKEFKAFAVKGNAMDLAVGVIIGAAFGKIVASLVDDMIMPPLGWLIGGIDFTDFKFQLPILMDGMQAVTINYGNFIQVMLNFIIVAFAIFMLVKGMNRLRAKEEAKPAAKAAPSAEQALLKEIRDLLKAQAKAKR